MDRLNRHLTAGLAGLLLLAALGLGTIAGVSPAAARPAHGSAFAAARRQWLRSACVAAAQEGTVWRMAAGDLKRARPQTKADRAAIGRLYGLVRLPETSETKRQMHQFVADAKALNRFFHTPGVFLTAPSHCS